MFISRCRGRTTMGLRTRTRRCRPTRERSAIGKDCAAVSVALVERYAPCWHRRRSLNEACLRVAGYLTERSPGMAQSSDGGGAMIAWSAGALSALRNSGAMANSVHSWKRTAGDMKLWPFARTSARLAPIETRSAQNGGSQGGAGFSDAMVAALLAQAAGGTTADPSATAALEAAAGSYARAFAVATVDPGHPGDAGANPGAAGAGCARFDPARRMRLGNRGGP